MGSLLRHPLMWHSSCHNACNSLVISTHTYTVAIKRCFAFLAFGRQVAKVETIKSHMVRRCTANTAVPLHTLPDDTFPKGNGSRVMLHSVAQASEIHCPTGGRTPHPRTHRIQPPRIDYVLGGPSTLPPCRCHLLMPIASYTSSA